MINKFL